MTLGPMILQVHPTLGGQSELRATFHKLLEPRGNLRNRRKYSVEGFL